MRGLILHLLLVFTLFKHQTGAGVGAVQHDVDFIEGEPVFHQAVKSFKAGAGVVAEKSTILRLRQEPYSITRCIGTSK